MVKISVIVPVYNKAPWLKECINSLTEQTLKDIEIICVDDKSTDDSLDILLSYADSDSRIKVLRHERNRGLSASRNTGMNAAAGEFIAFVDADDFTDKDFFEKLYNASESADVVKGEIWEYDGNLNRCVKSSISDSNDKIKETGNPVWFYDGITSAIYRREFIAGNSISFSENLFYNEDTVFVVQVVAKKPEIKVADGAKYYYRFVPDSLSRVFSEKIIEGFYLSAIATMECLGSSHLSGGDIGIILNNLFKLMSFFLNSGMLSYERVCTIKKGFLKLMRHESSDKKEDIKVSVIVPVHNGEDYLRRTLACLTFQSLYEIEIICVNDGSTDGSLSIINEYAGDDSRIRVIDLKKNEGASKARNIGIKSASGEYIAFMDQDDRIDLLFYEKLYKGAKDNHADIAKGGAVEIDYTGRMHSSRMFTVQKSPFYFFNNWWTGIYKRSMLLENNIFLPEGYTLGEDLKFLFDAVSHANKVFPVPNIYYYYIKRRNSEDSEYTPPGKVQSALAVLRYILSKVDEFDFLGKDPELYTLYYLLYISHIAERITRCTDEHSKKLCMDFVFETFCKCGMKDEILKRLSFSKPILTQCLEKNDKTFFEQLSLKDALSDVFLERTAAVRASSVPCTVVAAFTDRTPAEKYILNNRFLKEENITCVLKDNSADNSSIGQLFNSVMAELGPENDEWMIFIHDDFEFLTYPSDILSELDKNRIYGPVGAKAYFDRYKAGLAVKGHVYGKDAYCNFHDEHHFDYSDLGVDTLDSMCLIVHSSLIAKYGLRFDENLRFDLYGEEFCLRAAGEYNIPVEVIRFDAVHHSSHLNHRGEKEGYLTQLEYLNSKYPDEMFGGTVSPVGGKIVPLMSDSEFAMYKIRYEIRTKQKF